MKNDGLFSQLPAPGSEELPEALLREISGGRFAHDVGRAFRFLAIAFARGVPSAITDAAANSMRCGC